MESSGEEKKLQALFSELKATEEQSAPRFATVWNRAQSRTRRARAFHPAFVAAMGLLVCAVLGLAVWSRYRQSTPTPTVVRVETPAQPNTGSVPLVKNGEVTGDPTPLPLPTPTTAPIPRRNKPAVRRNSAQLAANRKLTRDAKAITDWQSPTSALLSSSSDELFSSLPQLNENSSGLQSFLPSRPN